MQFTEEQIAIINSDEDIRINAVAGSGKTTTLIEYAHTRPKSAKILYLAFNKSVKNEAIKKFQDKGLYNVKVETAHSLAYKFVFYNCNYKLKSEGYKTQEIVDILNLKDNGEKHGRYVMANHINKFISYFCNSAKEKVKELNYMDVVYGEKSENFISKNYSELEKQTRIMLAKMNNGEIDISHDFYLKKFQLMKPILHYHYILFDEGQDASGAMLDVFMQQKATKVIVGDTHQQIYGWRFAINSLEKVDFKTYHLSTSFRFGQEIANLAMKVLEMKKSLHISSFCDVNIKGIALIEPYKNKAVIARTNIGLLMKAIEYIIEKDSVKKIYFEGNINSYTYANDGASLFDILNLYNRKYRKIKDKFIKTMGSITELEDYIDKTGDTELGMMLEIVKEYENDIPQILKEIKEKHVGDKNKEEAEMIFSTVHKCKGLEYGAVQLVNDFITQKKLYDYSETDGLNIAKIIEEINLLYVAVTRGMKYVFLSEDILPEGFEKCKNIYITQDKQIQKKLKSIDVKYQKKQSSKVEKEKTYNIDEIRLNHKEAYKTWTKEQDDELTVMFCEGITVKDIAKYFGRTKNAIYSRIKKLELIEKYK